MNLLSLYFVFFYIGLFTIGGGLVAITLMQQLVVERFALVDLQLFYNMIAVSESTPGPIGINMATYVGQTLYGPLGAIVTTLGVVSPSLIIIVLIARSYSRFHQSPLVQAGFSILKPATTGVILVALAGVFKVALLSSFALSQLKANLAAVISSNAPATQLSDIRLALLHLIQYKSLAFYIAACFALFKLKLHPIIIVAAGALFGVLCL